MIGVVYTSANESFKKYNLYTYPRRKKAFKALKRYV